MNRIRRTLLSPDVLYGELYKEIQLKQIFSDTKTFVDCVAKISPEEIVKIYNEQKHLTNFDLKQFVNQYFNIPTFPGKDLISNRNINTIDHINNLWQILIRSSDENILGSSRIALPYPYIVPGGRFREIFYWDSYFTMLGLSLLPNQHKLIENMIDNFCYLIDQFGFIPNGNRTYFLSRSQPPFFVCMIHLYAQLTSNPKQIQSKYLPKLHKEYNYWMEDSHLLNQNNFYSKHVVRLENGDILNRYFDNLTRPRPESYPKEVEECKRAKQLFNIDEQTFYMHNRAACESGWDFSSRWFKDQRNKESNQAAFILPIDLNCLIYFIEFSLYQFYQQENNQQLTQHFFNLAQQRKSTILNLFWSQEKQFFFDYNFIEKSLTNVYSLAAVFPLFFNLATKQQAECVRQQIQEKFLEKGGLKTTLHQTGQQWDSPFGWAPLQWITYQAMYNYQFFSLANQIRNNWINLNDQVFKLTGKMTEKYNVIDQTQGGGGNYPLQDGFGWTNGVYLKLFYQPQLEF